MYRGFRPAHSTSNLLYPKLFTFNCTLGIGADLLAQAIEERRLLATVADLARFEKESTPTLLSYPASVLLSAG